MQEGYEMFSGRCRVCGTAFLNSTQEQWLRDRVEDPKTLDLILHICPECRGKGHGIVRR
ncbi:MAG: hypothetical protein JSW25_09575 [Thermoplasmata archaeon]|nr:MAG: hypothetical protein JSW25_09575 [Thermoplasmata archaeon]